MVCIIKKSSYQNYSRKTFGAISHKLQKDKIVREKELDAVSQISIEQIKQQEHSWKDEWLCLFFTILMGLHFVPYFQDTMERGWSILQNADPMFWYIILTIVGASFGVTTMNKLKKK